MKKIVNILFDIIIILLIVGLYIAVYSFIFESFRERKRKETTKQILNKVDDKKKDFGNTPPEEVKVKYNNRNYTVLGTIIIKKIGINDPILKENTYDSYNTSVVKMSGPALNTKGNVSIGGHNYMRGNFFIKIMRLRKNDVVTITDLSGKSVNYYVYEYRVTSKTDSSYLKQSSGNSMEVTLVTCTDRGKERYYVKARAK